MVTASISLRDAGRTFGASRALAGVGLGLEPGVTGLLGPNGAGQTTLLRLLAATALPPTQGQLSVRRVWRADAPDPAASVSWRTGTGRYRNAGPHMRDGVEHVEPSLEDAYLLLRGGAPEHRTTGEVAS